MSLTVTEKFAIDAGYESPNNQLFTTTARRYFDVILGGSETILDVLTSTDLPQVPSLHPTIPFLRQSGLGVRRLSPVHYEVTANYGAQGNGKPNTNPLDEVAQVEFDAIVSEEEFDTDINGDAMVMVTGEAFNPRIRVPVYDNVIRVTRNLPPNKVDPNTISAYRNSVNNDNWYGLPPGTVRITMFKAQSISDDEQTYWRVSAEFQIRRGAPRTTDDKAWYKRVLAEGYMACFAAGQKPFRFGGAKVLHKVSDGTYISNKANAEWYEFQVFESKSFNDLGLI